MERPGNVMSVHRPTALGGLGRLLLVPAIGDNKRHQDQRQQHQRKYDVGSSRHCAPLEVGFTVCTVAPVQSLSHRNYNEFGSAVLTFRANMALQGLIDRSFWIG